MDVCVVDPLLRPGRFRVPDPRPVHLPQRHQPGTGGQPDRQREVQALLTINGAIQRVRIMGQDQLVLTNQMGRHLEDPAPVIELRIGSPDLDHVIALIFQQSGRSRRHDCSLPGLLPFQQVRNLLYRHIIGFLGQCIVPVPPGLGLQGRDVNRDPVQPR